MATLASDEARPGHEVGATEQPGAPGAARWIAAVPAVVALGICLLQLHIPHWWSGVDGYDDGVYVGSAIELVHGVLPYRDYALVQPPGLTLLLSPAALLCRLLGRGTQDVVFLSRLLTAIVTAVDAALVALVVRHRGAVAMFVAGMAFACFPAANTADSVALLEPYVDLCCLLGLLLLFSHGRVTTGWRVYFAGIAFGLACGFKVWALLPAAIVFVFAGLAGRDRIFRFAAGVATGIAVIFGPFAAVAPRAMFRDVFSAQVNRLKLEGIHEIFDRLYDIFGFNEISRAWAITLFIAGWLVIVAFAHTRTPAADRAASFERCLATVSLVSIVIFVLGSPFYPHYAFLVTPWLAILIGSVTARALSNASSRWTPSGRILTATVLIATVVLSTAVSIPAFHVFESANYGLENSENLALVTNLPASSCIVTDQVSMIVSANKLPVGNRHCPVLLDSDGIHLVQVARAGDGRASNQALAHRWKRWFSKADYVYLSDRFRLRIPWPHWLAGWFHTHFVLMPVTQGLGSVYRAR